MTTPASLTARMDQVEWAALEYSFSDPSDVSALIQTIISGDEAEACEACESLHQQLVHQASIYSSTYEAIPFLIEALTLIRDKPRACLAVLELLDDIAGSCLHCVERECGSGASPAEVEERWGISDKWIRRLWLGSELFVRIFQEEKDALLRGRVAHLLGLLVSLGPTSVPTEASHHYPAVVEALVVALEAPEPDPARPSVIFAVGKAAAHDLSLIGRMRNAVTRPDVEEMTRIVTALRIILIGGGQHASLDEVDLLIFVMCRAGETRNEVQAFRLNGYSRWQIMTGLYAWSAGDPARMHRVLPAALAGIGLASGHSSEADLALAFQWLWPDRRVRFADGERFAFVCPPAMTPGDLGSIARQVVQACYDNPGIWQPATGNTTLVFRGCGLPETRQGLKDLLEQRE